MAKAIAVSATSSGSGKTLITLGLLRALRHKGLCVASAKVGPDYIDPCFHAAATGLPCYNLDPWAMSEGQIRALLDDLGTKADLIVIEGVMGLFDGPRGMKGSTADLASLLDIPVLLALDCRHQAQSAAAVAHGFATFRPDVKIAGVILNRVASERHDILLREALGGHAVLGTLRQEEALGLPSRHLGLVQAREHAALESFIEAAAARVTQAGLADAILPLAAGISSSAPRRSVLAPLAQTIAIARDEAFSFAYPHLLDGWHKAGASLSFFSPLADETPDAAAEAVFLPGGYPELHAGKLAASARFLGGLRHHPGLVYGECGGFMVLGESLTDAQGTRHAMAGLLPLATSFARRKLHLGYRRLKALPGAPWFRPLNAHEFHYSTIAHEGAAERLFEASDAAGAALPAMGLKRGRVMGSYAHIISEAA